jgi:glucose/arabinose dehydrogenase
MCRPSIRVLAICVLTCCAPVSSVVTVASANDGPPVPALRPVGAAVFRQPIFIDWPDDGQPEAPAGFRVERFAAGLDNPRWPLVLPNGDVLVSQARTEKLGGIPSELTAELTGQGVLGPSPNNIVLLRQTGGGIDRHVLLDGQRQPFGMAFLDGYLYVANTDALLRFPYRVGQLRIEHEPEVLAKIPSGEQPGRWNNHWTRNLIVDVARDKLFLSVGSATDIDADGHAHPDRAAIWELNADGSGKRVYATGLRNPVGMDIEPDTGALWTTVNERDGLGEETPPDYLTRVVDGAFYGWPYVYFGTYPDPTHERKNPDRVRDAQRTARVPDLALGPHTVPLGILFYRGEQFPERYRHGAFVARRGGVSRTRFLGIDVVFLPFEDGVPTGRVEPFLTGFIADLDEGTVHGRPVGLAMLPDGSLLVTDDAANVIWRVAYSGTE